MSDAKPKVTYTYPEALDTLNLILSMKGLVLVESGHYLRLVPFKELPAMPLRIMRGSDQTGDVRPGEVLTVVQEVKNLDAKEVADSIATMKTRGLTVTTIDPKTSAAFRAEAEAFMKTMRGNMVPADVYDAAVRERDAFRKTQK